MPKVKPRRTPGKPKCSHCKRILRPGPIHCCARRHREALWNSVLHADRMEEERTRPVPF
jgi:hypothetical protein